MRKRFEKRQWFKRGFTILELTASITIFIILTSVVLINYPRFGEQLGLDLRAQDVALLTRQAQVFALGVRGTAFSAAPEFEQGVFGIYVTMVRPNQLRFFADRGDINQAYDAGLGDCGTVGSECVEIFNLTRGYIISDICVYNISGEQCGVSELHIAYKRPNPEAKITIGGIEEFSRAEIKLRSPRVSLTKEVAVYTSGQITVQEDS